MEYTIYTKIKERNGKTTEICAVDLPFYCRCPECNKETEISLFDEIAHNPDIDPFSSRFYCESCTAVFDEIREQVKHTLDDVDNMSAEKLHALSNLLDKFNEDCMEW
ncbi:MAG: hypothetical protein K2I80_08755 [Ruminococcus sp.]|nr:hypothetical protein [Ruminococcus sp.]